MVKCLRIINTISLWLGRIVSPLLGITMLIIVFEIVMRVVFNKSQIWAFELSIFIASAVYVVGGVYALHRKAHVSLDLLVNVISRRKQAILNVFTWPLVFLFVGVLLWRSFGPAVESFVRHETTATGWDPPLWPVRALIPIGSFFMLLQAIAMFIEDLHIAIKGKKLE
jgi:TRAP-type mannitol/chloroaromatic compound transport system permease small subunit